MCSNIIAFVLLCVGPSVHECHVIITVIVVTDILWNKYLEIF